MSNGLYRALYTFRKEQEKQNKSFFTPHEQLELAFYKARQEQKARSQKNERGTDVFYRMQQAEKRRRESEDLKKRTQERQRSRGQALSPDSIRELEDWKARLTPYRSRNATVLAHLNSQEMAFLKINPGLVKDVTRRYKPIAQKGQGGDTKLGEISQKTARLLDQLIHQGHKEVNQRTGLREYPPKKPLVDYSSSDEEQSAPSEKKTKSKMSFHQCNVPECGKSFSSENELFTHKKIQHLNPKVFLPTQGFPEKEWNWKNKEHEDFLNRLPKAEKEFLFKHPDKDFDKNKHLKELLSKSYNNTLPQSKIKKISDFDMNTPFIGDSCSSTTAYLTDKYLRKKFSEIDNLKKENKPYDPKGTLNPFQRKIEEKHFPSKTELLKGVKDPNKDVLDFARKAGAHKDFSAKDFDNILTPEAYLYGNNYFSSSRNGNEVTPMLSSKDLTSVRSQPLAVNKAFINDQLDEELPVNITASYMYNSPSTPTQSSSHAVVGLGHKGEDYSKRRDTKKSIRENLLKEYNDELPGELKTLLREKIQKYDMFPSNDYQDALYYYDPNNEGKMSKGYIHTTYGDIDSYKKNKSGFPNKERQFSIGSRDEYFLNPKNKKDINGTERDPKEYQVRLSSPYAFYNDKASSENSPEQFVYFEDLKSKNSK